MKYDDVKGLDSKATKEINGKQVVNEMLFRQIKFGTGKDYTVEDGDILNFKVKFANKK